MASMADIVDAQVDQVAATQYAVDGQVEDCQVSGPAEDFQANANCPDFTYAKRCLLPHQIALVPRRPLVCEPSTRLFKIALGLKLYYALDWRRSHTQARW